MLLLPLPPPPTSCRLKCHHRSNQLSGEESIMDLGMPQNLRFLQKTCEMGTAYEALRAERNQFAGELEAAMLAMAGMKDAPEGREKSLEEAREANKVLTEEVERMKKQRTALHNQMVVLNKRCIAQEKYVNDWAVQMMTRLAGKPYVLPSAYTVCVTLGFYCILALLLQTFALTLKLKRAVERPFTITPLGEDTNRDLLRAHIRVGKVSPFIGRLREVIGRIDKEHWPEDESRQEMESLMVRLEEIPGRVQSWKKSAAARCDVALPWSESIARRCGR
ncbi:hypothetical protein ZWY2020_024610 [Hordeum vulgare]|nr:hypothetical protein ZWY2020_024610 [Hordeum vulgare]